MKRISETFSYDGHDFRVEGWLFDRPDDYDRPLKCERCGKSTPIRLLERWDYVTAKGDTICAPIWHLVCSCTGHLAILDESDPKYTLGPRPLLTVDIDGSLE